MLTMLVCATDVEWAATAMAVGLFELPTPEVAEGCPSGLTCATGGAVPVASVTPTTVLRAADFVAGLSGVEVELMATMGVAVCDTSWVDRTACEVAAGVPATGVVGIGGIPPK